MNKRKIMARIALENFKAQAKKLTPKQDRTAGTAKPSPTADVHRFQPPTKGKLTRTHLDHVADMDEDEIETLAVEAKMDLMKMTVTHQTHRLYDLRVRLLDEILDSLNKKRVELGRNPLEWTLSLFLILLKAMQETGVGKSASGYMSAILFFQRAGTFGTWALENEVELRNLIKGLKYNSGDRRHVRARGTFTADMFEHFMEWMEEQRYPISLRAALKLAFLMALRINELVGLKHEDIVIDFDGNMLMDLPNKMHRSKNPTTQSPRVQKPVLDPTAVEIILAARTGKRLGEYLFPPGIWREKMARDAVKAWAAEHAMEFLGDIANVFLDGPHCLRHGGMARVKERVVQILSETLKAELGGCSAGNVEYYGRSNETRSDAARKRIRE